MNCRDAALGYAARCWRVAPIEPGTKWPPMKEWQHVATIDEATIRMWYKHRYHDHGVGIMTGPTSGVLVIDVDTADGKLGAESLAALEAAHGSLPDTVTAITGSGGRHLYFRYPTDREIRNGAAKYLGPGLDVRGDGGQVVAPPTIHQDTHQPYRWAEGRAPDEIELADCPWLDVLDPPVPPPVEVPMVPVDDDVGSPAAWFNERTTWYELLEADGWTPGGANGNGEVRWTRPGKTRREGISATTGHNGRDCLKVFTSSTDLDADGAYSRFGYWAATRYGNDRSACARALRVEMGDSPSLIRSQPLDWEPGGVEDDPTPEPLPRGPRGGIVTAELGRRVRDDLGLELGADGRLWRYDNGVYRPDGDAWAKARTCGLLGPRYTRSLVDEVLGWMRAHRLPTIGIQPDPRWINTTNGMVDWATGERYDHDPIFRSTWQVPHPWPINGVPDNEVVLDFLEQVLPGDAVTFALELFGYALLSANPLRKAVLLLGPGGNGKSTFLGLLRALLGVDNVAAVPLQTLAENRFAGASLFGKAANISGDLDARAIKRTDLFKMLTGGDLIFAERKFGHAFSFICWALPVFAANEAPISSDQSSAWFDRWLVVPFTRRFGEDEVDPNTLARITRPDALEGLLYLAVAGLRELMARGHFIEPDSVRKAGGEYRERLDTVQGFLAERCCFDSEVWLPRADLYRAYRDWCTTNGRLPLAAYTFTDHLRRYLVESSIDVVERKRSGVRGWAGIGWSS